MIRNQHQRGRKKPGVVITTPINLSADLIFTKAALRNEFGLSKTTIGTEIRLGRLACFRVAGRTYFSAAQVRAWLEAGLYKPKTRENRNGRFEDLNAEM